MIILYLQKYIQGGKGSVTFSESIKQEIMAENYKYVEKVTVEVRKNCSNNA